MTRYIMSQKTYNRFVTMGYDLTCSLCEGVPILPGDEVESKARSGRRGPKLYHAECYEDAHYDVEDDDIDEEEE